MFKFKGSGLSTLYALLELFTTSGIWIKTPLDNLKMT